MSYSLTFNSESRFCVLETGTNLVFSWSCSSGVQRPYCLAVTLLCLVRGATEIFTRALSAVLAVPPHRPAPSLQCPSRGLLALGLSETELHFLCQLFLSTKGAEPLLWDSAPPEELTWRGQRLSSSGIHSCPPSSCLVPTCPFCQDPLIWVWDHLGFVYSPPLLSSSLKSDLKTHKGVCAAYHLYKFKRNSYICLNYMRKDLQETQETHNFITCGKGRSISGRGIWRDFHCVSLHI